MVVLFGVVAYVLKISEEPQLLMISDALRLLIETLAFQAGFVNAEGNFWRDFHTKLRCFQLVAFFLALTSRVMEVPLAEINDLFTLYNLAVSGLFF